MKPAPASGPGLLAVGSVALDTLEGAFGRVVDEPGGSAIYFALAARLVGVRVRPVAPVGVDWAAELIELLDRLEIDAGLISVVAAPTYRWSAASVGAARANTEVSSQDSIYASWEPAIPTGYRGWAFVGSVAPALQVAAAERLRGCGLLAGDAMLSYAVRAPSKARQLISLCDWFFANDAEFAALGGDASDPEATRCAWGLDGLCVKLGPQGADLRTRVGSWTMPAVPADVVDTTGAGDCLAAGLLSRWWLADGDPGALRESLAYGLAAASIVIEDIGYRSLARAQPGELRQRARWLLGA